VVDKVKKMKAWLSFTLVITTLIFLAFVLAFIVYIPSSVENMIGLPGEIISIPRSIILSAQLFPGINSFSTSQTQNIEPKTFIVKPASTASEIANNLVNEGLINSSKDLLFYWQYKGLDRFIRDGVYLIRPNTLKKDLGDQLASGVTGYTTFSFLAGWRKEEVDNLLIEIGLVRYSSEVFLSACRPEYFENDNSIEGFLFPGNYQIPEGVTGEDVYCIFVERFFATLPEDYEEKIAEMGLSLYEAVTLASIIQREMVDESEAARIAGVFLNRLEIGMPLQSDPTVQYAVASRRADQGWWNVEISSEDLLIDSPYNTYQVEGLPPTPICNPGITALNAVAYPEMHDYFYFRAACDGSGSHNFSETYDQHLLAACE